MRSKKVGITLIVMTLFLMLILVTAGYSKEAIKPEVSLKIIRGDQIKTFTLNKLKAIPPPIELKAIYGGHVVVF